MVGILLALLLLGGPTSAEPVRFAQSYYRDEAYLNAYRQAVLYYNPGLGTQQLETVIRALLHYAHHYRLDPRLVTALVACESGFRPEAVSSAGARGLGQLMPGTAHAEGVDPGSITSNIHGACRVLRRHLDRYADRSGQGQLELALAAYNAGPGAVERYGGIPPYPETLGYVSRVLAEYRSLCGR
ncbi:MAG: lytic transglycosylase domain-containing protein [Burkholderiales bacterium]|jgi:soluble lytic murein transglycosylase-like protein|nr:lytic transglycosylase domain-containing protein [Burkholderiales bacterium]